MIPINELRLEPSKFGKYDTDSIELRKCKVLEDLGRINMFVGPNNSGKSRFMRQLLSLDNLEYTSTEGRNSIAFGNNIISFVRSLLPHFGDTQDGYQNFLNQALPNHQDRVWLTPPNVPNTAIDELAKKLQDTNQNLPAVRLNGPQKSFQPSVEEFLGGSSPEKEVSIYAREAIAHCVRMINQFRSTEGFSEGAEPQKIVRTFIPPIRTLRRISEERDALEELYKSEYPELYDQTGLAVLTGQNLYEQFTNHLLGDYDARKKIEGFQDFIGNTFFNGQRVTVIPKTGDRKLHIKIGSEAEFPIHQLGDGIQQVILMMFPIFMGSKDNEYHFVFIDEPEMNLHPGFQRLFVDTVLKYKSNSCKVFVSTHSNHFLDITLDHSDISIFGFEKEFRDPNSDARVPNFLVRRTNSGDFRALELLGIRNSSIFLSNCTIWVEGITDRKYIQRWLSLYHETEGTKKQLYEDLHYSFVEYAGSNIDHWRFSEETADSIDARRVCSRVFLVADRDNVTEQPKRTRHERLQSALGDRYYRLPVREIENLLTPETIKTVILSYGEDPGKIKDFSQSDYALDYLGKFIESAVIKGHPKRKGRYWNGAGTVSDKVRFCEKATKAISSFEELSPQAQELTKKIHEFIEERNS